MGAKVDSLFAAILLLHAFFELETTKDYTKTNIYEPFFIELLLM